MSTEQKAETASPIAEPVAWGCQSHGARVACHAPSRSGAQAHAAAATSATITTTGTKTELTWSASRCTEARLDCARSTTAAMRARPVCSPVAVTRTTRLPSTLDEPASSGAPGTLRTGIASPVSNDSSTEESPSSTTASTGTWSPGRRRRRSPGFRSATGVSDSVSPRSSRCAVAGARAIRARRASPARACMRASSAWPRLMRVRMLTDSAKNRCACGCVVNSQRLQR